MTKIGKISRFVSLILFFCASVAWAKVTVTAEPDRNEMGLGDTIQVTVSVNVTESEDVAEPRLPQLPDFDLVGTQRQSGTSVKLQTTPSGMQYQQIEMNDFVYMLAAKREGNYTIPAVEVNVSGKIYYTKPFIIKVSKDGSGAGVAPKGTPSTDEDDEFLRQLLRQRSGGGNSFPNSRNVPKNPNEAFSVVVDVDKTEVYEGEQILVNWYLYTRGNLLSLDRLKFPNLKGFWKEIIEEVPALNFTQELVNGVPYRKALLAAHALFPIKPGVAIIDEYKIKAQVQVPTGLYGSFGFGKPYTFTKASDRIKITVKPLPAEGRPASFTGAVGQFDVHALVDSQSFPMNQPFTLRVRFEGAGNAKLIELPQLNLPPSLELYETKSESKFFKNGQSYKEFVNLVIPRQEGDMEIPSLSFSMFNPATNRYETKTTEPIKVHITAAVQGTGNANRMAEPEAPKKEAPAAVLQLPEIISVADAGVVSARWMRGAFWGGIFAFISLILLWQAKVQFEWGARRRDLRVVLNARLKKIRPLINKGDWKACGIETTNLIYQILGEISGQGGATQELSRLLEEGPPSLRRELGAEFAKLLDIFQALGFAPEAMVGAYKEKDALKKNVDAVEKLLLKAIALSQEEQIK